MQLHRLKLYKFEVEAIKQTHHDGLLNTTLPSQCLKKTPYQRISQKLNKIQYIASFISFSISLFPKNHLQTVLQVYQVIFKLGMKVAMPWLHPPHLKTHRTLKKPPTAVKIVLSLIVLKMNLLPRRKNQIFEFLNVSSAPFESQTDKSLIILLSSLNSVVTTKLRTIDIGIFFFFSQLL